MFTIIWQYAVKPQFEQQFIEYYHANGTWVKFFQQSPHYFETEFIEVDSHQFITIDKWFNEDMYRQFLKNEKEKYDAIDKHCEGFTVEETLVGYFFLMEI